jgi:hypothetical protein
MVAISDNLAREVRQAVRGIYGDTGVDIIFESGTRGTNAGYIEDGVARLYPTTIARSKRVGNFNDALKGAAAHEVAHEFYGVAEGQPNYDARHEAMSRRVIHDLMEAGELGAAEELESMSFGGRNTDGGGELDYLRRGLQRSGRGRGAANGKEDLTPFDVMEQRANYMSDNYPVVNTKEVGDWWKIPLYRGIGGAADYVSKTLFPEASRDTMIEDVAGSTFDNIAKSFRTSSAQMASKIFPRVRMWSAFSDSSTVIEEVYTYKTVSGANTIEIPYYVKMRGDQVNAQKMQAQLAFVQNRIISPYNQVDSFALEHLEPFFKDNATDPLTQGDVKRYFEALEGELARWWMRADMWLTVQYGQKTAVGPGITRYTEPAEKSGFWYQLGRLIGDESPSSWTSWGYWEVYSWLTNAADVVYSLPLAIGESIKLPPTYMRRIVTDRQKLVGDLTRGIMRGRDVNMRFEGYGVTEQQVEEAAGEARDSLHLN